MLRLMAEMLKLPVALFVSGMEVMARAMREYQALSNRALDTAVEQIRSGAEPAVDTGPEKAEGTKIADGEKRARNAPEPKNKETNAMMDEQALRSKDTKTVRYRIIFTKRNHETTLKDELATINYATDPMSVGGRYISDFWAGAALGDERKPLKRLYDAKYHDAEHTEDDAALGIVKGKKITETQVKDEKKYPKLGWTIPSDDKRYITFKADLLDQIPRQEGEYDRERNEELRAIRRALEEL